MPTDNRNPSSFLNSDQLNNCRVGRSQFNCETGLENLTGDLGFFNTTDQIAAVFVFIHIVSPKDHIALISTTKRIGFNAACMSFVV